MPFNQSIHKTSSLQSLIPRPSAGDTFIYGSTYALQRPQHAHNNNMFGSTSSVQNSVASTPLVGMGRILQRNLNEAVSSANGGKEVGGGIGQSRDTICSERFSVRGSSAHLFAAIGRVHHVKEDPRDFTAKSVQREAMQRLFDFLQENGFVWTIKSRPPSVHLLNPTSVETFRQVFDFLMSVLLGRYPTGGEDGKDRDQNKFVEEVNAQATQLGYPFANLLKRNTLRSPNTTSSWPIICGFLDWMREEAWLWLQMISFSETSPFFSMYFKSTVDGEDNINMENEFHSLRMEYMLETYKRFCRGDPDCEDLYDRFTAKLGAKYGDLAVNVEETREALRLRKQRFEDMVNNYESLDKINAKIGTLREKNDAKLLAIKEGKRINDEAERDINAIAHKERANQEEIQRLDALLAQKQKQVKSQRINKAQHATLRQELESIQSQSLSHRHEGETCQSMLEEQSTKKTILSQRMRNLISSIRGCLAEMAVATGPVVIPDYNDDEDAEEYIRNVKTIVDSATADLRTQMDNVTQLNEQSDGRYESRKSEMDRYLEEEKQNAQVEAALGLQLDELNLTKAPEKISALTEQNSAFCVNVTTLKKNDKELQTKLVGLKKKRDAKKRTLKKVKKELAYHDAYAQEKLNELQGKNESRIARLAELRKTLATLMETLDGNLKEFDSSILGALTGVKKK